MKKKFLSLLSVACKDFGLTSEAISQLVELGSEGLADDASDEDIKNKVDSLVPFAKAMQGEITRKTTKKTPSKKTQSNEEGEDEGDETAIAAIIAKQLAPITEQLQALQTENEALKTEKTKGERVAQIAAEAKALGIPDYLIKRINIADDADIKTELGSLKQELVNNNLLPKNSAEESIKTDEALKADAKTWAASLSDY